MIDGFEFNTCTKLAFFNDKLGKFSVCYGELSLGLEMFIKLEDKQ